MKYKSIDLRPIKARLAETSEGEWIAVSAAQHVPDPDREYKVIASNNGRTMLDTYWILTPIGPLYDNWIGRKRKDFEFMAAAHQDIPALIAELELMRASMLRMSMLLSTIRDRSLAGVIIPPYELHELVRAGLNEAVDIMDGEDKEEVSE